jgi:hypothetical protein
MILGRPNCESSLLNAFNLVHDFSQLEALFEQSQHPVLCFQRSFHSQVAVQFLHTLEFAPRSKLNKTGSVERGYSTVDE